MGAWGWVGGWAEFEDYVTCVSWIQQGCVLAVGISDGTVQVTHSGRHSMIGAGGTVSLKFQTSGKIDSLI